MATVNGGTGNDTINTGAENDSISSGAGDDSINSGAGNDTVDAGSGNDRVDAGAGNDSVRGGTGNDTLSGGDGRDTIDGGSDNDSISGGAGYDQLYGGDGDDTISGDGDYDDIYGGSGNDSISGGDGDDWMWGEAGDDTISGGAGADSAFGGDGNDSIDGGSGNDTLYGEAGNDNAQGGDGNDYVYGGSGNDTLSGGSGSDWVEGDDGNDSISGGADNDTVLGGRGSDTIEGGDGNDIVSGHAGDDALYGGDGDDRLYGGSGDDYFDGGAGNDTIYMSRDAGNGTYTNVGSETDHDVIRLNAGSGHDVAYDFQGEDDYIYIGSIPESDIIFTQTGPSTWVLTQSGGSPNDSLTINFAPGTEPDSEGDLRNQLVDDSEYTPPENGNGGTLNPACFTAQSHILTPSGIRRIGSLRAGDIVTTADEGPQSIVEVLETRFEVSDLANLSSRRPVVIEKGAFGCGLPTRRMHVSRQHAFAIKDGSALIRAVHVAEHFGLARIQNNRSNGIRYLHLLMEKHQLVQVDGIWTESFYAAPNGGQADILKTGTTLTHDARCRPLLSRADLRRTSPNASDIGRMPLQSAPRIREDVATASAPLCVSP
ncbi:MAG: Hint domain-containing protein [Sulfitobacter sp.]